MDTPVYIPHTRWPSVKWRYAIRAIYKTSSGILVGGRPGLSKNLECRRKVKGETFVLGGRSGRQVASRARGGPSSCEPRNTTPRRVFRFFPLHFAGSTYKWRMARRWACKNIGGLRLKSLLCPYEYVIWALRYFLLLRVSAQQKRRQGSLEFADKICRQNFSRNFWSGEEDNK